MVTDIKSEDFTKDPAKTTVYASGLKNRDNATQRYPSPKSLEESGIKLRSATQLQMDSVAKSR